MDIGEVVARNLRSLRQGMHLSLERVADMTGVSKSMLGQIERRETSPTISVLWKIANGLKISFTSLMETAPDDIVVVRANEVSEIPEDTGLIINRPLFTYDVQRRFEIYDVTIAPGGSHISQPHLRGTEEFVTVYAGYMKIIAGGREFLLARGDAIRFKADVSHEYHNMAEDMVRINMVIYYSQKPL